ncbi:branched-chain amino acid ABC transporter permease [Microbacterium marinilacus]|uniref:Branched-chain amino acid ABC transporter permease n=1 Tax=Microbacterium marinilacus TaxID=415209 RepID=A0ABP7BDU5_9MICO|nr:branched-chain amino acid ABC transporter permease [Microbacterium marinilacus]MBY0689381.1 branched-chain amino acid ABC transporter permease [Microbacterium marinilacus]
MNPRIASSRRTRNGAIVALATFLAALFAAVLLPTAAHAAEGDPYTISGNVRNEGTPLEGVELSVDGPGGVQEVVTDGDGRWSVDVPDNEASYVVTLDESSLPDGIAVVDESGEDETPNVKEVVVGPGGIAAVNFFIGQAERNVTSFFDQLVQRVFQGINFGLMLGLAAVGLSLVFGTTGISNFAHAEMVTFGAVIALFLVGPASLALPVWVGIPATIVLSAVLGYVLDLLLWRPLRRRGTGVVQLMILSIGLSLAMRYVYQFFIGGGTQQLPAMVPAVSIPLFGAVTTTLNDLISMGISIVVIVAFAIWLTRSRLGKATRAISDNPSLAAASGINVDHVVRVVWIISGALAGLAGVLYAYYRPGIRWDMGAQILLLVFAAVTLGGLGTAFGALVGALIIGVLVEASSLWIPADLRFAGALVVLIVILLVRPQGILGRRERIG